jgi:hypothetical protein
MRRLFLEVVKHEEFVEFEPERDESGKLVPKKDGRTAFLHLRAPNGTVIRVGVEPEQLNEFLGLMMPGYIFTDE